MPCPPSALRECGETVHVSGMSAWTDAALLNAAGIPAICFGPGDISLAHAAEEYIPLPEIDRAAEIKRLYVRPEFRKQGFADANCVHQLARAVLPLAGRVVTIVGMGRPAVARRRLEVDGEVVDEAGRQQRLDHLRPRAVGVELHREAGLLHPGQERREARLQRGLAAGEVDDVEIVVALQQPLSIKGRVLSTSASAFSLHSSSR